MIAEGVEEVMLEAETNNYAALKLYENLGFIRDKRLHKCAHRGGFTSLPRSPQNLADQHLYTAAVAVCWCYGSRQTWESTCLVCEHVNALETLAFEHMSRVSPRPFLFMCWSPFHLLRFHV